ncbi:hypothetical protein SCB49_07192 [unidentified eubacterium SCB49]|nr:hypothetical protein SCB49_07192 [unidentified eubacterium SCB49]
MLQTYVFETNNKTLQQTKLAYRNRDRTWWLKQKRTIL